ncbi:hypothetical protein ACTWPT_26290 [Nonomuraea sp. 3N208]|uniref:hypothetical protein n=1 Tax=Nonomuraea sp. 3N208 TaxID=3457421 RepID=UPI003FD547EB
MLNSGRDETERGFGFDPRDKSADEGGSGRGGFRIVAVSLVDDALEHAPCFVGLAASFRDDRVRGACSGETINSCAGLLTGHAVKNGGEVIEKCSLFRLKGQLARLVAAGCGRHLSSLRKVSTSQQAAASLTSVGVVNMRLAARGNRRPGAAYVAPAVGDG